MSLEKQGTVCHHPSDLETFERTYQKEILGQTFFGFLETHDTTLRDKNSAMAKGLRVWWFLNDPQQKRAHQYCREFVNRHDHQTKSASITDANRLAEILFDVIYDELLKLSGDGHNTPQQVCFTLFEFLNKLQSLHNKREQAREPELAQSQDLVDAMIYVLLSYHDHQDRDGHLKHLRALSKRVSGHERPLLRNIAIPLIILGCVIWATAVVISLPTLAPIVASLAVNTMVPYYVASLIAGYCALFLGVALWSLSQPRELAEQLERVAFVISDMPTSTAQDTDATQQEMPSQFLARKM